MNPPTKISYRVYHKGKKIDHFDKFYNWPFIWSVGGHISRVVNRRLRLLKITKIVNYGYKNQVRIYTTINPTLEVQWVEKYGKIS